MGAKQRRWTPQIDEYMLTLIADGVPFAVIADLIYIKYKTKFKGQNVRERYLWLTGQQKSKTTNYRDNTEL